MRVYAEGVERARVQQVAQAGALSEEEDRTGAFKQLAGISEKAEQTCNVGGREPTHFGDEARQIMRHIEAAAVGEVVAGVRLQGDQGDIVFHVPPRRAE